ncbi:Acetoin utilization protein AcuC [Seminavis robusta]|uniref:Acetoin utilization protein AcuC n=1 Tax=Seminavis robusta TaxID=568900 RepID=A0A9N8EIY2_9STRA|nr:Acetoin utilization protein AcuC [Seminavis robusta]|eukprot:Sro1030_g233350.1 Acetoin utilization protein AcuC (429) ;mRNA; f:12358-13644
MAYVSTCSRANALQMQRLLRPGRHCYAKSALYTSTSTGSNTSSDGTDTFDQARFQLFAGSASRVPSLDPVKNHRHCPLVYHEDYSFDGWPPEHSFPMDKFERLAHVLLNTPTATGIEEEDNEDKQPLVLDSQHFFRPLDYSSRNLPLLKNWLSGPLDKDFVQRFLEAQLSTEEARQIGFREQAHQPKLIRRTVLEVAGTVLTAQLACHYGIAAHLAGGTHHADHQKGAGYTILNDLIVAASCCLTPTDASSSLELPFPIDRVLVIDADVHQGDGTARCMQALPHLFHNRLFTLSLHCASNYPHPKAHSTYDVPLPDGMTDQEYLETLKRTVTKAVDEVQPDLILYDAGVDIYKGDRLGRLDVSLEGIRQRDRFVVEYCAVQMEIPVAAVIGGGYDKNNVTALAQRHAILHEECSRVWRDHQLWNKALV